MGRGTDDGALVGEGLLAGGLGWPAEFTMDFVLVGVGDEGIEETVGGGEFAEAFCGEEGAEAFLPVVVAAFDFAFGLRGWGVAELDAVEAEGCAELGEGIGVVSVKEGVVVHIDGQRPAVSLEDAGEEVEVGEEGFQVQYAPSKIGNAVDAWFGDGFFADSRDVFLHGLTGAKPPDGTLGFASFCLSAVDGGLRFRSNKPSRSVEMPNFTANCG